MGAGRSDVVALVRRAGLIAIVAAVMVPSASLGEDVRTVAARASGQACERDPSFGFELLYAHPAGAPSRFERIKDALVGAADRASAFVTSSTAAVPKRLRLVCGIEQVALAAPSSGALTFTTLRAELLADGFDSRDRKYVVWWDGASPDACGEASLVDDDRPDPAVNQNNIGPSFAFVYEPTSAGFCDWTSVLHEMLHTLGGVQDSAPHSTGAGHCTDGPDVLCRPDPSGARISSGCATVLMLDCGADDYFSLAPARGSYLDTHWNVASSRWVAAA